jgi:leader peptidase (prepilin peptidase)/N-methyltransferase
MIPADVIAPVGSGPDQVSGWTLIADVLARRWAILVPAAAVLAVPLLARHSPAAVWPALIYLTGAGLVLAAVDLTHRRLPNVVAFGAGLAALLLVPALSRHQVSAWIRAVEAGVAVAVVLGLIPGLDIGGGDAKLIGLLVMLPAWRGWLQVLPALLVFFVPAAVAGIALLVSGRARRADHFSYGPWLLLGAYLYLLLFAKAW